MATGTATAKGKARPAALVRAQHGAAAASLSKAERGVLDEALRRGADLADEMHSKVSAYGRWLLDSVFGGDTTAALDDKSKNEVWAELVRRAGGPSFPVSRRLLYVAVKIAAYDKRITDAAWRGLDAGRKEILLVLPGETELRRAAQQVTRYNLSQAKTRELVTGMLSDGTKTRQVRVTAPGIVGRVKKLRESIDGPSFLRRVGEIRAELEPPERRAIIEEIDHLREALSAVARELRGRR